LWSADEAWRLSLFALGSGAVTAGGGQVPGDSQRVLDNQDAIGDRVPDMPFGRYALVGVTLAGELTQEFEQF